MILLKCLVSYKDHRYPYWMGAQWSNRHVAIDNTKLQQLATQLRTQKKARMALPPSLPLT